MGTHTFDWNNLTPQEQAGYQSSANQTVQMEKDAGQTQAKDLLEAQRIVDEALKLAQGLTKDKGFNTALGTGNEVENHYNKEAAGVQAALQTASELYGKMADEFLAMEYAYLQTDKATAQGLKKWMKDGKETTSIDITG